MMVRIMADVARFVCNMIFMTAIVGFLMVGGVLVKLWRNRP